MPEWLKGVVFGLIIGTMITVYCYLVVMLIDWIERKTENED